MAEQQTVDITELATLGEQFPLRLMQLGFRLMQVMDEGGRDQYCYVLPPVCAVPAGPFLMGTDPQQDTQGIGAETPQHTVTLEEYAISTYPLTVAEFACCVLATNCVAPHDWEIQQHHEDHPIVSVSWNDVLAYVQWFAQITGERWRLPTEAEWEKAARGTDGRIYPWGDQWDKTRANTRDGGPGGTTPVGSYPDGASPYGVQDMAGNVMEWTNTIFKPYPYQANDGREKRSNPRRRHKTMRGGSWNSDPHGTRAACRFLYLPTNTNSIFGVRLVRRDVAD